MQRFLNKSNFLLNNIRRIATNTHLKNNNPTSSSIGKKHENKFESNLHPTSLFDKRVLVWNKKYAKVEDVPNLVPLDTMHTAMSRLRIRIANLIILITVIVFITISVQGHQKKAEKLAEMKIEQDIARREMILQMRNETK